MPREDEEAIPIPKPEDVAFSNRYSTVGAPVAEAVKRPTGYRGGEISTIADMTQPQRDIAATHRRKYGETPDLTLLRKDPGGLGKSPMMPMPMDPATKRVIEAGRTVDITPEGAGVVTGAMPTSPVDLTPRLGEIEAGVDGALPSAFDTEKAHKLGMERYGEGQAYVPYGQPRLAPGQKSIYGDAIDSVLGPAPPVGDDAKFADLMSRATQPGSGQPGAIPSEIAAPARSGNAMVDLFRFVSHNKRVQARNKLIAEKQERDLATEKFDIEQEFKEKKLTSEEKGREGALDLSRRKAIATTAKGAEKLDPFVKQAEALAFKKYPDFAYLPKKEQDTIMLQEIEGVEKRHGRATKKKKPSLEAFVSAAKEQGSTMSQGDLETEFKKRYGA